MEKKNILFILPFMPYPLKSGGHQALFNGIRAVSDEYNVFVTYLATDNAEYHIAETEFLRRLPSLTLLPLLQPEPEQPKKTQLLYGKVKRLVKNLFGIHECNPTINKYYCWLDAVRPTNQNYANHVCSIMSNYRIDVVQVEMPWIIGVVYYIPEDIKKIFVHHEIGFVKHELEMNDMHLSTTLEARAYADFTKMIEINLLNMYDTIITLSETDKQKLLDAGVTAPIVSSFAVVDANPSIKFTTPGKVLSFVGPDSHTPNYLGIKWFLENCWGLLKRRDSEYSLKIIGKWTDKSQEEILSKYADISFCGFVDDLGEALSGTVMIVPITVGGGIRMKILEASSRGFHLSALLSAQRVSQ